jgi:hypothetical protein
MRMRHGGGVAPGAVQSIRTHDMRRDGLHATADDAASDPGFGRLVSVCSLGLLVSGSCRRLDRLLEAVAVYAEANDLTWIE